VASAAPSPFLWWLPSPDGSPFPYADLNQMRAPAQLPSLLLALLAVAPSALAAQPHEHRAEAVAADADALYFAGRPRDAYDLLAEHLEANPWDYEALWRASRSAVVLGVAEEGVEPQNAWLDPAITLGDRAVAEDPQGIDGLYWRGAAAGRRAMNAGPGYGAELAQRVYDDAHSILAIDPLHGGAHNLLGKLNYEIMSLSRVERFIGRTLVRKQALRDSSWEQAETHLRTATESWPDYVLFQFDLALLHRKRGRTEESLTAFQRVTGMVPVHPTDMSFQTDAQRYIEEMSDR
jgi:tetratricopeptide (TPR) repeat protein